MIDIVLGILLITQAPYRDRIYLDLDKLAGIESSKNPEAHNVRTEARGLFQITPILLREWNRYYPKERYTAQDLYQPKVNVKIAKWYLKKRIPQMLKHYRKPLTIENILISWNAGVSYVVNEKELPSETKAFIKKYNQH